ncbi:MAG: sodium-translocating pyrophosphatase [Candidatus Bathyarchaeia archaeon]
MDLTIVAPAAGLSALTFAGYLVWHVLRQPAGTAKMRELSDSIREGSTVYLKRQYMVIVLLGATLAIALALILNPFEALAFVMGAICSGLAGFIGMYAATRANVRAAHAAEFGLNKALSIALRGGMVTGMGVTGLGLLGLSALYFITGDPAQVSGFALGTALIALFMRVGGGIYTKAADVGADLVGKVEVGIPEDDPRNPGVIADQVGDNVGDVAGMSSDLFESYVCAIFPAMLLGVAHGVGGIVFPLAVPAVGIFSSILAMFFVRAEGERLGGAFLNALVITGIPIIIASYILSQQMFGDLNMFYAILAGVSAGLSFAFITKHYTLYEHKPTQRIAKAAQTGPATNILTGFATGLESTALPTIAVCIAVFISYKCAGLYGISLTAVGLTSLLPQVVAMDSYGPIVDNASGIIEMTGPAGEAREVTDALDAAGNTTKAVCKGFAIGAATLAAIALFAGYIETAGIEVIHIADPRALIGLLIGGMLSFTFCSFLIHAVGNAAFTMIREIRRQFDEIPGLREGNAKPDYAECISISTNAALKGLIIPGLLAIITPITVGFALGVEAVGGLYIGLIISAFPLALLLAHAGTAWDNAKKYVEAGHFGGKGTPTHAATVIGDTVGDPFKDTAGPSLDILMDIVGVIAILFAHLFLVFSLF